MAYYTQGQGLISQRRGNASYFYHYDGLGSTKALSDANQNIQASYKYDAWGNILQTSGTITNPYLYVGELGYYSDGDSGMYLLTQRWYNSVIGRFVEKDKIRKKNPYEYCQPITLVDPQGEVCIRLGVWTKTHKHVQTHYGDWKLKAWGLHPRWQIPWCAWEREIRQEGRIEIIYWEHYICIECGEYGPVINHKKEYAGSEIYLFKKKGTQYAMTIAQLWVYDPVTVVDAKKSCEKQGPPTWVDWTYWEYTIWQ
ncbi:MAG: RHS repeat-associated core domain-containing protein [Candidatus Methanomethylicaceae archaeon]